MCELQKINWEDQISRLISDFSLEISETMLLESEDDFVYISDPDTYELYLISLADKQSYDGIWGDYKGKKCYEVLQKRTTPCPFCTNQYLSREKYYVWEFYNPVVQGNFILKDKLVEWNGKLVRLEVVTNVTHPDRMITVLKETLEWQNMLTGCLQTFITAADMESAFNEILDMLQQYYQADRVCIYHFGKHEGMDQLFQTKNSQLHRCIFKPSEETLAVWDGMMEGGKQVLMKNVEEWAKSNPEGYHYFKDKGIYSVCLTPLFLDGKMGGMISLYNIHEHWKDLYLLNTLALHISIQFMKERAEMETKRILYHDAVTGYRTFEWYRMEADRILEENNGKQYCVWYCDIKNFKYINDVYGYDEGNRILKYLADWLEDNIRKGEAFARMSADNFSVLLWYDDYRELEERFYSMAREMTRYGQSVGNRYKLELAVGVYQLDLNKEVLSMEEMMNRANMAQKSVKRQIGSRIAVYSEEMRNKVLSDMAMETEMRDAMEKGEFVLYLQPQINLKSAENRDAMKAEVLVRWIRDGRMYALPGDFIELFERNGMIVELDFYIFKQACQYIRKMNSEYRTSICLSVNVSRVTMLQPGFVDRYCSIKELYHIERGEIELEFTENIAVENHSLFSSIIERLKENGFLCAMDDFGTGMSSLNVLKSLPIDVLKLDRLFFTPTGDENRGMTVIKSVFDMAQKLGITTVAEGIEHEDQVLTLKKLGCDYIQGYVYSRPITVEEFVERYLKGDDNEGFTEGMPDRRSTGGPSDV